MTSLAPVAFRHCRCQRPLPQRDESGVAVCSTCGHEVPAWHGRKLYLCREQHTRPEATREALRRFPEARVVSINPRKVRDGKVVSAQGRSSSSGGIGRPIWEIELGLK